MTWTSAVTMVTPLVLLVACLLAPSMQQNNQPGRVCRRVVDMVFVIDGSNSVGQRDFDLMIQTVNRAVGALEFGPDQARVGAVLYSFWVTAVVDLQDNINSFRRALNNFEFPDESTYTNRGIQAATQVLDRASRRKDCPHVMFVITDGQSTDQASTRREAIIAASRGIDLWAVGVGAEVNVTELESIASTGAAQTFLIENFQKVPDRLVNMTREVCETSHVRPTFIPTFPTTVDPYRTPPSTRPTIVRQSTTPRDLIPSVGPPDVFVPEDLCRDAPKKGGVGYVPYPARCDLVIQCYYGQYGQVITAITRRCPVGQFWNQTILECADSWTVSCPHDPCSHCEGGVTASYEAVYKSVAIPGECRSYYECRNGKAYPGCCPAGHRFDKVLGCTRSRGEECRDACGICREGMNVCEKIPNTQSPNTYFTYLKTNQLYPMPCQSGRFNVYRCTCTEPRTCRPFLTQRNGFGTCNNSKGGLFRLPATQSWGENRTYTFQFSLGDPNSELIMSSTCGHLRTLRVFRFANRIMLELAVNSTLLASTEVFVNPRSSQQQVPVTVLTTKDTLTLRVTQDNLEHTSAVSVPEGRCHDMPCEVELGARSSGRVCEPITQFNAYDCLLA